MNSLSTVGDPTVSRESLPRQIDAHELWRATADYSSPTSHNARLTRRLEGSNMAHVPSPNFADLDWWRHSVVYQIYPRSFHDGNGDGTGDLLGMSHALGYLAALGVDAVWVSPWYPSPLAFGGPAGEPIIDADGHEEQWYCHMFAPEQPDWNWENPAVADMFDAVIRFWFDRGIDGLSLIHI